MGVWNCYVLTRSYSGYIWKSIIWFWVGFSRFLCMQIFLKTTSQLLCFFNVLGATIIFANLYKDIELRYTTVCSKMAIPEMTAFPLCINGTFKMCTTQLLTQVCDLRSSFPLSPVIKVWSGLENWFKLNGSVPWQQRDCPCMYSYCIYTACTWSRHTWLHLTVSPGGHAVSTPQSRSYCFFGNTGVWGRGLKARFPRAKHLRAWLIDLFSLP